MDGSIFAKHVAFQTLETQKKGNNHYHKMEKGYCTNHFIAGITQ